MLLLRLEENTLMINSSLEGAILMGLAFTYLYLLIANS